MPEVEERPGHAVKRTLAAALRDIRTSWIKFAAADVLYKAIAFAVFLPLIGVLARLLIARSGSAALADVDIVRFLFTSRKGMVGLIIISALVTAVAALEQACLMTIGLGRERGTRLRVRDAFAHATFRSWAILRLTAILVVRLLLIALPFAAALGAAYWLLLRRYDINYYLTAHPPEFWAAVSIAGVLIALLAMALGKRIASWILALPIVVFENVFPLLAFGESARRMEGRRMVAALSLATWGAASIGVTWLATNILEALGRAIAPAFGSTMAGMFLFIGSYAVLWLAAFVAIGVLTAALLAQIIVRLYVDAGLTAAVKLPQPFHGELEIEGRHLRISWRALIAGLTVTVIAASFLANVLLKATWTDHPVLVFAHRGASSEAPENPLASFRLAGEQHTDSVELDVQESSDGVVLVNHDVDLMKDGRSPLKIWQSTAEQLRAVDIGSSFAPSFADQRVPTLAEVLVLCKGVSRMDIELKDYGHDQQLEERVIHLVEAAGMQDQIVTMSLSLPMVEKMKRLRPHWTSGLLAAKAIGDASRLPGDFLAVQSATATRRFIMSAHSAGKPVYVWTVDDPQRMIRFIGFGADGLITNRPALAKEVIAKYEGMSRVERLFVFVMTRLGATEDFSGPGEDLRP